ncbi:hypothetical protein [Falsarthrobacter nasiphocae]|uniref:Uncharacterized protein n=1 Tax=Falsarthrobacter nasiphocae TaxID=189863 RepID=A0AAE3YFL0_9MICC|nr:hypothetical protein [Falsarthrobacter nasiphocae]MDR6891116.1 hypothetical protein [Falsarthrobacter nasiphocae]
MSHTPEQSLEDLVSLMREHLAALRESRGDGDFAVEALYDRVGDAFADYADALDEEFGEALPMDLVDDED